MDSSGKPSGAVAKQVNEADTNNAGGVDARVEVVSMDDSGKPRGAVAKLVTSSS